MAEKTRYSDAELEEFRAIIMEKLELAQRDYDRLKSSIMNKDGNDTDDTSPTYKVLEEGANTLSKEETTRLAARQLKFIQGLQAALIRIENKTYGICRETGKLIPKERLRAVPHATLSIDGKEKTFYLFSSKDQNLSISVQFFLLSCSRSFPAVLPQYLKYSFPVRPLQQETDSCNLSLQISRPAEV